MDMGMLLQAAKTQGDAIDAQMKALLSRPLPEEKLKSIEETAEKVQLAEILNSLSLPEFVLAVKALFTKCAETQSLVLNDILRYGKDSEYGRKYGFDQIQSVDDFRKAVPITTWEDYEPYSERMQKGEADLLFPGKPTFFYLTSGTTSAYKYIPESEKETIARKALTKARYTALVQASSVKAAIRIFPFYNKADGFFTEGGIWAGSASGRTAQIAGNEGFSSLMAYSSRVVEELEGEALYYTIMRLTIAYDDISLVMGNNAHVMRSMVDFAREHAEDIIQDIRNGTCRYELSEELKALEKQALTPNPARADELEALFREGHFTPRYYWKNLLVASFWLGGSIGIFVEEVRDLFPETTLFMDAGYGASEAKINIPLHPGQASGPLSVFSSFFEFIPEKGGDPLLAEELEDGETYDLILTTYGGLYRYRIKDYVKVEGFTGTTPNIRFISKSSDVANLVDEKITGSTLAEAIREAAEENGLSFTFTQVYPDEQTTHYVICLEAKGPHGDADAFARVMDEALCKKVEIYDLYRNRLNLLKPCTLRFMKQGWGDALAEEYKKGNATTSQVKVPVIARQLPDKSWMME